MYVGQGYDIVWSSNIVCPSFEQYLKMIDYSALLVALNKLIFFDDETETGGLFRILARLMAAKSKLPSRPNLTDLASLLGRYFQIRDDYMNLNSDDVRAFPPKHTPKSPVYYKYHTLAHLTLISTLSRRDSARI